MENKKNIVFNTIFRIAILAVVILFLINIGRTIYKNHNIEIKISSLENEISELENEKLNLKNRILFYETDIYKELEARRHLNYQKKDEKVVIFLKKNPSENITNENIPKNTINCPRGTVVIGSTPAQVVAACGQPTHIQNVSEQLQKHTGKISHLIYQPQPYLPETIFVFKNGALVGTK